MTGLSILFNSSGIQLNDSLIGNFSKDSDMPNCNREESRLSPSLWIQNVYRPVTTAQGGLISPANGRVQLVFHGEVYNCPELAEHLGEERPTIKSIADGPNLVALGLEREGMQFIERINGSFVLLAWYPHEKKLYLANDRFGLRPHYYGWCGEIIFVSPTVAAIHRGWNRQTRIDRVGALEFFAFQHLMGNRTLVEDISLLPPASICRVERAALKTNKYWDFPYPDKPLTGTEQELSDELGNKFTVAVNRRLPSDCPLGVTLSGGLDSRTLAGIASQSISDLLVFTLGDPDCMDRRFASEVAQQIGAKHCTVSPENVDWEKNFYTSARLCEGMSSVLHAHILMLMPYLENSVGVVLDGLGGGAINGHNLTRQMMRHSTSSGDTANALFKNFNSFFDISQIRNLFRDKSFHENIPILKESLRKRVEECQSPLVANIVDYCFQKGVQRRFEINGNILLRNFVEVRTPFYDYDLIDFAIAIPPRLRLNRRLYKDAVRNLFPELRNIGYTPTGENLEHSYSATYILRALRRPDTVIRSYMPQSIKTFLRQSLNVVLPHKYDKGVSYHTVFGSELAALFPAFNDARRGWKQLTSYDVIEEILSEASSDKTMKQALKLSLWLTFQMYREVSGVEI